jgi:hypothetical protein
MFLAELIQLVVCDLSPNPSWVFLFHIGQHPMKLARVGIELFEKGDIHRYVFAMVSTCETPTVCAKADQLSSLLHPARGDHGNLLFRVVTMLAAHMLT